MRAVHGLTNQHISTHIHTHNTTATPSRLLLSNEIWPTGGWGSLEYGTVGFTQGQVLGGRWKPLHHLMEQHLYRDTISVCGMDGSCYTRNDNALAPFAGTLTVSLLHFASASEALVSSTPLALPRGGAAFQYSCFAGGSSSLALAGACPPLAGALTAAGCAANGTDCAAVVRVVEGGSGAVVDENFQLLAPPSALALPASSVSAQVAEGVPARAGDGARAVTLSTEGGLALYAVLTTLAQGRFEENFISLVPGVRTVWFIPFEGFEEGQLAASLRVEHVAMYM